LVRLGWNRFECQLGALTSESRILHAQKPTTLDSLRNFGARPESCPVRRGADNDPSTDVDAAVGPLLAHKITRAI
jgi:hypothetical protein